MGQASNPRHGDWRPDEKGVMPNGDVGGDGQHGDSYSVRFTRAVQVDENRSPR